MKEAHRCSERQVTLATHARVCTRIRSFLRYFFFHWLSHSLGNGAMRQGQFQGKRRRALTDSSLEEESPRVVVVADRWSDGNEDVHSGGRFARACPAVHAAPRSHNACPPCFSGAENISVLLRRRRYESAVVTRAVFLCRARRKCVPTAAVNAVLEYITP